MTDLVEKLERELDRLRAENEYLRRRQRVGENAIQIVAAISALVPLKDSLKANQTGQTLVDYFRDALRAKEAGDGQV